MEDVIKRAHTEDQQFKILQERIEDQYLIHGKLEEKFRTIMREREIIESAIGGVLEFEQICERKLESLMKTVTEL